jgi:RHS repeat-associated protein
VTEETSNGITHTHVYDLAGNRKRTEYGTGREVTMTYDALNRMSTLSEGGRLTKWHYDRGGRCARLEQGNGLINRQTYDEMGRLTRRSLHQPAATVAMLSLSTTYDAAGNVVRQAENWLTGSGAVPSQSRVTQMGYDLNSRLTSETVTTGGASTVQTSYTYDAASNRTSKIVSTGPEAGRWTYASNALNQLTGFTDHAPDGTLRHTVAFTYDANGNRATRTQDGSQTHTYAWDEFNRLKSVTMGSDTHAYGYDYRTRRITRTEPGSSGATAITYAGGVSVAEFDAEWDTTSPPALPTVPELPEYPELPEAPEEPELPSLLQNPCPEIEYYDNGYYDEFGVWVNVWLPLQYTVDARNAWLVENDSYQALWHSIFDPYHAEVEALQAAYNVAWTEAVYGYMGALQEYAHEHGLEAIPASVLEGNAVLASLSFTTIGALKDYLLMRLLALYPGELPHIPGLTGALQAEYQRGPDMGGGVGGLLYSLRDNVAKFNLSNARGDVVAQTDTEGDITWSASYEAYGKRPVEEGANADRQRANTKEEDPTGLLNEGHRYRDLETGTWLSRDPAGFVDGPNLYAYVRQNPWSKFDPLGLREEGMPGFTFRTDHNGYTHILSGSFFGKGELHSLATEVVVNDHRPDLYDKAWEKFGPFARDKGYSEVASWALHGQYFPEENNRYWDKLGAGLMIALGGGGRGPQTRLKTSPDVRRYSNGAKPSESPKIDHQVSVDKIHTAAFGDSPFGKRIPMTITVTPQGKIILSQVGGHPSPKARAAAEAIYGKGGVDFVRGGKTTAGHHSEVRGANGAADSVAGSKQYTTHFACDSCAAQQSQLGIQNMTGTAAQNGGRITREKAKTE